MLSLIKTWWAEVKSTSELQARSCFIPILVMSIFQDLTVTEIWNSNTILYLPWDIALRNPFLQNKLTIIYIYLELDPYCLQAQCVLSLNKETTKWNYILFVNKSFRNLFLSTIHILFLPLATVLLFFYRKEGKKRRAFCMR